jgi:nucleolar protein 4
LIEEGMPAAQGVSKGDMAKRKQVEHEKATKLRSPNFHVSTTRLALHNLPKDLMEKDLKELVIKAVKSRASKQHPVVKQVKILRDEVKGMPSVGGRSRGAAFVEFTEHQHALVALRVLNNNPGLFCFLTLALCLL